MIKIDKCKNENGYYFFITTDEGKFEISFAGNLDLYWSNIYMSTLYEEPSFKKFTISKENYFLYSLFEKLYNGVKNCNVFEMNGVDMNLCQNFDELQNRKEQLKIMDYDLKNYQEYNQERLFKNSIIEWHSDDFEYDKASILKILKEGETFVVIFEKSKEVAGIMTYSVVISNSGSRYLPFNMLFMKMYHSLIEYYPEFHQVHIEEVLYQKKLKK